MIKKSALYIATFSGLTLAVIFLFDAVLMPAYVRMEAGRYMVNVLSLIHI